MQQGDDAVAASLGDEKVLQSFKLIVSLVGELMALVPEADAWGRANGHPEVQRYPQYERVRQIGQEFDALGGLAGMQKALLATQRRLADHPPQKYSYAIVSHGWSGVGSRQA